MASCFHCVCQSSFGCQRGLATHKQTCQQFLDHTRNNFSILRSTTTFDAGEGGSGTDAAATYDDDYIFGIEYDLDRQGEVDDAPVDWTINADNYSDDGDNYSDDGNDHSAAIRFGNLADLYENMVDKDDASFDSIDASDLSWMSDSSASDSYSDSDTSVLSFDDDRLPEFAPPMFRHIPPHMSSAYQFQVELNSLFDQNKASLTMYDEVIRLLNEYISSREFNRNIVLPTRKQFMVATEKIFNIQSFKPIHGNVTLCNNTAVTVPVFDAQAMILSLLHDPMIMKKENLAPGYDIFTGAVDDNECNNVYGEIHTGDRWAPALTRHCGKDGSYMPIALVIFGDKSHTDLHGLLSVEPVSFTLSLFNRSARNLAEFWRLLGYIPNLTAGMGEANRTSAKDKVQNVHRCLSFVLKSLREIRRRGGIRTVVMGREVHIKVWIHFIIGDTEGNNKWLGHYPGNNAGTQRPYRDCQCSFRELSNIMPNCIYATVEEMTDAHALLRRDRSSGLELFQSMSRYPIVNALLHPGLPMSDDIYGPFRMTPPELLHTSGAGLILYIFKALAERLGCGIYRNELDEWHVITCRALRRQSERDIPRGATRNGVLDGTKCQASERRGNLFSVACIAHTTSGRRLKEGLRMSDAKWGQLRLFMRQYLAMEEWFHAHNNKAEVRNARRKIGRVLKALQELFPRGEGTNGYNIPKMHGMAKMQPYILLYGCAENFHGGTGESAHKVFVKAPGLKTQRRVSEFAVQTAKQYHHAMIARHAKTSMSFGNALVDDGNSSCEVQTPAMDGKYCIDMASANVEEMLSFLHNDLVEFYHDNWKEICRRSVTSTTIITGYTRGRYIDDEGHQTIFYAHPSYRGSPWYDWAYVHFVQDDDEEVYYPSKVLGFFETAGGVKAVIHCASKPLKWSVVEKKMFVSFDLGTTKASFVSVPLDSFVYPLCVLEDHGGPTNRYVVVLPRRGWVQHFGRDID